MPNDPSLWPGLLDLSRASPLQMAEDELMIFLEEEAKGDSPQNLAITLVSAASWLVKAEYWAEARYVFYQAHDRADLKFQGWISNQISMVEKRMKPLVLPSTPVDPDGPFWRLANKGE